MRRAEEAVGAAGGGVGGGRLAPSGCTIWILQFSSRLVKQLQLSGRSGIRGEQLLEPGLSRTFTSLSWTHFCGASAASGRGGG